MSAPSSAASAASTSDWSEPVCASCGSAREEAIQTARQRSEHSGRKESTAVRCCDGTGPTHHATRTWFVSENQRAEVLLTDYARQLTSGGGKPGQGYPMVLTSSAEASPAKTSPSPADARDSQASAAPSSSSSHESLSLFAPAGFSSRTYPDYFPLTVDEISQSFSRRWPSSGMAFAGECWTLDSSEYPSGAVECSLSDILEPEVPSRFYLSSKAAKGILRRARRRGRTLPEHLEAALEGVAGAMTSNGREPS